jgi:Flp pilus assembly protein TadG
MPRRTTRRRGAALLELALTLPLLLLLTGGIVDFSRFVYHYVAVSSSAGAAARYATFHPVNSSTLSNWNVKTRQTALDDLQGIAGFNPAKVTIPNPTITTETSGLRLRRVQVQVSYDFQTLIPWPGIPSSFSITRAVTMRVMR